MDSIHDSLEQQVKRAQYPEQKHLKEWASTHNLSTEDGTHWFKGTAMVVVENNDLRRGVITLFHDHKASGHPGITKTLQLIAPYVTDRSTGPDSGHVTLTRSDSILLL